MVSKTSFLTLILLLLLVMVAFFVSGVLMMKSEYSHSILSILIGLTGIYGLIFFYNRTNRDITFLFDAIRNKDTSINFQTSIKNKSLKRLHESMNNLNSHFQKIQLESEYKEKFYKALIQQSSSGLVVLKNNQDIEITNETACKYAGISPATTNLKVLKIKNEDFFNLLCKVRPGENITSRNILEGMAQLLIFRATEIYDGNNTLKIISIQDIKQELDEKELESYQKLIRILTHEIMNSVAPLTSISKALYGFFIKNECPIKPSEINDSIVNATVLGLKTIEEQGNGLIKFVNSYRQLTRIPQPVYKPFNSKDWIDELTIIFSEKFATNNIKYIFEVDEHIKEIIADKNLINQVVVNILNNALDALLLKEDNRKIKISISENKEGRILIKIGNNGPCISDELKEKIFIPFFTTKENGSGIGLSLSRQIMKLHKGTITVISSVDYGTIFTLEI